MSAVYSFSERLRRHAHVMHNKVTIFQANRKKYNGLGDYQHSQNWSEVVKQREIERCSPFLQQFQTSLQDRQGDKVHGRC